MFCSCPFLITCPKNDTCRCTIFCINFRFPIVSLSTCSFVYFSFQLIFCIRRINHISVASSLLICCWFNIQFSNPYRSLGMTYQFKIRYRKSNGILRLASIFFMSAKAIFVSAIRHLISVMCPPLVVIQLPRYLKFSTSLRTSPFSLISVFNFPSPFSTMMTVFFVFISIPNFLHFALVFSSRICRSSAVFAVKTVSSPNRILLILWPPILTPFSVYCSHYHLRI